MIDISNVVWRKDRITREYVQENAELLARLEEMKPRKLGEACTYCVSIENPYAYEIMRRSGHLEKYRAALYAKERREIFNRACNYHGMRVI